MHFWSDKLLFKYWKFWPWRFIFLVYVSWRVDRIYKSCLLILSDKICREICMRSRLFAIRIRSCLKFSYKIFGCVHWIHFTFDGLQPPHNTEIYSHFGFNHITQKNLIRIVGQEVSLTWNIWYVMFFVFRHWDGIIVLTIYPGKFFVFVIAKLKISKFISTWWLLIFY